MSVLCRADLHQYTLGDDDGFGVAGTGSYAADFQVDPGQTISTWGTGDGDGTDEMILSGNDRRDFVFTYEAFSSITTASLFMQYFDWPESWSGRLWINRVATPYVFETIPLDQAPPWTVLGRTIDLMPYVEHLYDGRAVFNFIGEGTDAYAIDYLTLSINGSVVPVPGAALLGALGLGSV